MEKNNFLLYPFKHTYLLHELKNVIKDRIPLSRDRSSFGGTTYDLTIKQRPISFNRSSYVDIKKAINPDVDTYMLKE